MKICSKCGVEKSLTDFHKDKRIKCGLAASCKKCVALKHAIYRKENRAKYRAYNFKYRAKPGYKEKKKEQYKVYYKTNKEKIAEANKQKRLRRVIKIYNPSRPKPEYCECCGDKENGRSLCLDHDHETKKFRGWLCTRCNSAIGNLGDDVEGIQKALTYLENCNQDWLYA